MQLELELKESFNIVFLTYCKATKQDPEKVSQMLDFILWVDREKREFGDVSNPDFHKWLFEKYEVRS